MSLKTAFLIWVGLAIVAQNTAAAFVGTAPCFNAPGRLSTTISTCSPSRAFSNAPSKFSYDLIVRSPGKLQSLHMATIANSESETIRQAAEKPISQARFKETVRTLFDQIDMDGNGVVDAEEIQNLAGYSPLHQ